MTDTSLCFSVRWAGSNKPIAPRLVFSSLKYKPHLNGSLLQMKVGGLVNIDPKSIKIWCILIRMLRTRLAPPVQVHRLAKHSFVSQSTF
jgi:hypothetical protein